MEVISPGMNGHGPFPDQFVPIDPQSMVHHMTDLLEVTLGASIEDLHRTGSLLSEPNKQETVQRCRRFASESQTALYVQKISVATEQSNGTYGESRRYSGE